CCLPSRCISFFLCHVWPKQWSSDNFFGYLSLTLLFFLGCQTRNMDMWNDPFKLSNLMIPVWEKSRPRLHSTARLGTIEDAKKYLDEGDDINLMTKHEPYAPLHDAVYEHRLAMVKLLVERKANIHLKTIGGSDTALGLAANSSLPKSTEATM